MITANNPRIGWHSFAVHGTLVADQEDPDHPIQHVANPATYLQWRAIDLSEQSITIVLPAAQQADYVAVFGHNWGSLGTTVHLEYSDNSGSSWQPLRSPTIPDEDDRVFWRDFDSTLSDLFRIRLEPGAGDPPEAAVIYFGRALIVPRRIYVGHAPLPFSREPRITTGVSETGQFLGRVLESITNSTSVGINHLAPEWIREQFDPFVRACLTRPFFWSWRPGKYPRESGLAWFMGPPPAPQNSVENGMMSVSWQMQGVILPPHHRAPSPSVSS